jgi:phosphopantothenoylcysteine decarboxylase/phosphopantothenate--cysteine ligase
MLTGKHIILGVTGGIAAYKSAFLVRELVRGGAEVQVVMTRAATEFITPLTLGTLSRREVLIDMFPSAKDRPIGQWTRHIDLAMWADVMLIAPASANTIAKIAFGTADNFLTTLVLALRCPLLIAPAMDVDMYANEATQRNLTMLREMGVSIIGPETGELASGLSGPGRLAEVDKLVQALRHALSFGGRDLTDRKILVTAGPTYEPIDPVRFIGNRSSGKMGFALAVAGVQRGAEVTLVSGPVHLHTPRNVKRIDVETAEEMAGVVNREFLHSDVLIMAAAIADFSPRHAVQHKIRREGTNGETMTIALKRNPDILKDLSSKKSHQIVVGFALEMEDGLENARKKLASKHLDFIVLNNPMEDGAAFGADTNVVTLIAPGTDPEKLPRLPKIDVAHAILTRVAHLFSVAPVARGN